ncbi:MAG: hypothetical protein RBS78_00125 [Coriobacteriia bacterium]|nr:hypothetical protein [Coriobacteriia bacterium]
MLVVLRVLGAFLDDLALDGGRLALDGGSRGGCLDREVQGRGGESRRGSFEER